eukprot:1161611-Pelagomonas_calceolata.AAC.3
MLAVLNHTRPSWRKRDRMHTHTHAHHTPGRQTHLQLYLVYEVPQLLLPHVHLTPLYLTPVSRAQSPAAPAAPHAPHTCTCILHLQCYLTPVAVSHTCSCILCTKSRCSCCPARISSPSSASAAVLVDAKEASSSVALAPAAASITRSCGQSKGSRVKEINGIHQQRHEQRQHASLTAGTKKEAATGQQVASQAGALVPYMQWSMGCQEMRDSTCQIAPPAYWLRREIRDSIN